MKKSKNKMESSKNNRKDLGIKISKIGLWVNFALFVIKYFAGYIANSVSMKADAINNLSDFGSVIILLISFYMIARPADKEHPFGHARFEYLGSAMVAMIIMLIGVELGKSSFHKILNPTPIQTSWIFYSVLVISITTKLMLFFYYKKQANQINSPLLMATAKDSLTDVFATGGLLLAIVLGKLLGIFIDGYAGLIISILILYSGFSILRNTSNRLLGQRPNQDLFDAIKQFIRAQDGILGMHDLIIHDYGINNYFATAHVEVDSAKNIHISHELIDRIEREIALNFNVNLLLHMDPIDLDNPELNEVKIRIMEFLKSIDENIKSHDYRMIATEKDKKIVFDVKVPDSCTITNQELRLRLQSFLSEINSDYSAYITIDHNYEMDTVIIPDE